MIPSQGGRLSARDVVAVLQIETQDAALKQDRDDLLKLAVQQVVQSLRYIDKVVVSVVMLEHVDVVDNVAGRRSVPVLVVSDRDVLSNRPVGIG